ncbi:hypothetical protein CAI21_13600 [Alkalilimnicola ehrlichii]|uniref:Carrier domain-containing protein n=1 Tax=Alkalilimnicola ehrlichii TaxID=351052 RepID=A0A3E0WRI4_9GAMM|nr:non-ribosomal peptide synthetase [Alkalilimnicola ehrlichii]RFA27952.1 hypothetical protein CAI21_13600 [Alkalilimnicola ehrlichii]RFA34596.1 hypothetical protein CAL65_14620 [Alkalilimnicola ehrlichii]
MLTRLFGTEERLAGLPSNLTDIVTAGEQLYIGEALRAYLKGNPSVRLHNHYGVSESHVVTAWTVSGADPVVPVKAPIGGAVAGAKVWLEGASGQPVRVGEVGEVVIAGSCLALGYLNRPEEEGKRFAQVNGERVYRTGDLARYLPSGLLEFVGRVDDRVKVRGHLVELGDVETALRGHPAVQECAVDVVSTASDEKQLAAWYTASASCEPQELRRYLASQLPSFMLPSKLYPCETLPIGPTGKVDRAALKQKDRAVKAEERKTAADSQKPGPLLAVVREVLTQALEVSDLPADASFFDAGATSFTLAEAAQALGRRLGVGVLAVDLFRFPTLARLTAELARRQAPEEGAAIGPSHPGVGIAPRAVPWPS